MNLKNLGKVAGIVFLVFSFSCFRSKAQGITPPPDPDFLLDSWNFDDTNWLSALGDAPVSFTNLYNPPSFDGNALQVDSTNQAFLQYNIVDATITNLTFKEGTIELWILPDWNSGIGPGDWGRLIDAGAYGTNSPSSWWSLYFSPDGSTLNFSSETNGIFTNYLSYPISWDTNTWHLVDLTFAFYRSQLFIDGQLVTNGSGSFYIPSAEVISNGFFVGSDDTGWQQSRSLIDDLATYNYDLSEYDVSNDYEAGLQIMNGGGFSPDDGPPGPGGGGGGSGGGGSGGSYTPPDYGTNLWIQAFEISSNYFTGILSNTLADVEYQLLFVNSLGAQWAPVPDGAVVGSETTNWTPWSVPFEPTTNFFLTALSYQDDSGTGIPDWWWLKYFGQDTNVDAFADPIGDGWTLLQDYQNGLSPTNWVTPPAPQGLTIDNFNNSNDTATLSWLAPPGPVTGYTIQTLFGTTNLGNVTSYVDNESFVDDTYSVEANYAGGSSAWSASVLVQGSTSINIVPGPQGNLYLVASGLPSDLSAIQINLNSWDSGNYITTEFQQSGNYINQGNFPTDPLNNSSFQISAADITNGICEIPPSDVSAFYPYVFEIETIRSNGVTSVATQSGSQDGSTPLAEVPFIDGRADFKDNLRFLFRAANDLTSGAPFEFVDAQFTDLGFSWPSNHICVDFYSDGGGYDGSLNVASYPDPLEPLEDNVFNKNFVFDANNLTNSIIDHYVIPNTGVTYPIVGGGEVYSAGYNYNQVEYSLNVNAFLADPVVPLSAISPNDSTYIMPSSFEGGQDFLDNLDNSPESGDTNIYGLPFVANENAWLSNSVYYYQTNYPKEEEDDYSIFDWPFPDAQLPGFQTVNYYFCRPGIDPMPESTDFASTNTTPLIIVPVGGQPWWYPNASTQLAGYAQVSVTNAFPGVYGYIGQYFTNAYQVDNNGNVTTNTTGILSPYGQFFATKPGPAALITMPDPDTGQQGTGIVYCISMQVDKNHDGVMDTNFFGEDTTSQGSPMEFWVNNGCDVPSRSVFGGLDEDLRVPPATPNYAQRRITCPRDLENFARLWICGLPAALSNEDYYATLSCSAISGSPAINLYFPETNGGTGYLTDTNVASGLAGHSAIATISPTNSSYVLPFWLFNGQNQFFMFEGAGVGEGQFTLSIYQGSNVIAQTSTFIDLHDIKDFYESAVITNNMSGAISNWTSSIETVQQATSSVLGTDTNLIVMVHGIDVDNWSWLDDSETVLKRLYWAGYNGKFMTVKWPCNFFNLNTLLTLDSTVFNDSEVKAYKASGALKTYLTQLRSRFPGYQLNIFAHSQGNAVVGEAIAQGAPYDTYILTEGAMPDSCYDAGAPLNDDLVADDSAFGPTPESQPMGYADIYTDTNFTGRIVNFYNTNDPVLAKWQIDQGAAKPNTLPTPYSYSGTTGYYRLGFPNEYVVTDPEESRAEISRSRTLSIGQSPPETGHGVIQSGIDLTADFGFGGAFPADHSAQWTWPIQTTLPYYKEILTKIETPP